MGGQGRMLVDAPMPLPLELPIVLGFPPRGFERMQMGGAREDTRLVETPMTLPLELPIVLGFRPRGFAAGDGPHARQRYLQNRIGH
jgi:hypothetical protein